MFNWIILFFYFCLILIIKSDGLVDIDDKPDIENLLRQGDMSTNLDGNKDFIVLLGKTGGGKSTLSKFLRKDPTLRIKMNKGGDLIFVDNEVKIGSKSSLKSKTFYPNVDVDPKTGMLIIDCAGFQDTRSPEFDLVAGFLNKKILDTAKSLKIVIVEDYENVRLNKERNSFINTLTHISNLIGKNVNSFNRSIGLVATKIDSTKTDNMLLFSVKAFLDEVLVDLSVAKVNDTLESAKLSTKIKILEYLLEGENVAVFRRPNEMDDDLWELEPLKNNFHQIRRLVFENLTFSSSFTNKFKVTIDAKTVVYINKHMLSTDADPLKDLFKKLYDELLEIFSKNVNVTLRPISDKIESVIRYCETYIAVLNAVNSTEQIEIFLKQRGVDNKVLAELRFQLTKTSFLLDVIDGSFNELAAKCSSFYGWKPVLLSSVRAELNFQFWLKAISKESECYKVQLSRNQLQRDFSNVNDFKLLQSELRTLGFSASTHFLASSLNPNKGNLNDLKRLFREIMYGPVKFQKESNSLFVTGHFVVLSQIMQTIRNSFPLHELVIMASSKLFIDQDFELQHTNLIIVAPIVEIIQERTIYLRGEDAGAQNKARSSDSKEKAGDDGVQGYAGYSSGNFIVYALKVTNALSLTVQTEGGNGGDGQNGGNGFPAQKSPLPDYEDYSLASDYYLEKKGYKREIKDNNLDNGYTVRNYEGSSIATNGGNGGGAGWGALAGSQNYFIKNTVDKDTVTKKFKNGKHGQPGNGGIAGSTTFSCMYKKYSCERDGWNSFISFFGGYNDYAYDCTKLIEEGNCNTMLPEAENGKKGQLRTNLQRNHMYATETKLMQVIIFFCGAIVKEKFALKPDNSAIDFLNYLLKIEDQSLSNFVSFVEKIDDFGALESKRDIQGYAISNLKLIYAVMFNSFKTYQKHCAHCNNAHLQVVDLMFISRLENLQTLLQRKQVINLSSRVETQLKRLADVARVTRDVGKFEAVTEEKLALNKSITDAGKVIEEIHERKMKELESKSQAKIQEMLSKTEYFKKSYKENIGKLDDYQKELKTQMTSKVALGIVNIFSSLASIIYPPAGILGSTITSTVSAFLPSSSRDIKNFQPQLPKGILNAKRMILELHDEVTKQTNFQRTQMDTAIREVLKAETSEGSFLQMENRQVIRNFLSDPIPKVNLTSAFVAVITDLNLKITSLKESNSTEKTIDKFMLLKSNLNRAKYVAGAAGSTVALIYESKNYNLQVDQIEALKKSNLDAIEEMTNFAKILYNDFKPMLSNILATFDDIASNLKDKNAVVLQFQKLDIKTYARKCISMITKFTEGILDEQEGLASVLIELQDSLTTIVDAYDKITELHYRVQLTDFLGQLHGGDCMRTLTSDPIACNWYQKVASQLKNNEIIREYAYIFTAYLQALFPYGGAKINSLQATLFLLLGNSNLPVQDKIGNLKAAVQTIKKDLDDVNEMILNDKDKDIAIAHFNSKFISSGSFCVWPNSIYFEQIKSILKGEEITLVASVVSPGVKNAVKFRSVMLNFTSKDAYVAIEIQNLLKHFEIEMIHGGESYYRCGANYYTIGAADRLNFKMSFELDRNGDSVFRNKVYEKFKYSDVPLSPYTVWKFKLNNLSSQNEKLLHNKMSLLAGKVDLELVGEGYFTEEGAKICDSDLSQFYSYFDVGINEFSIRKP